MTSPDLEPDCEAGCAPPREIEHLFGHDTAMAQFDTAQQSGRLHHAWMITGPKGVGKASFAYTAAMSLLAGSSDAAAARQKVRAQAHPNLYVLREPWDEKTKRFRKVITVPEIRRFSSFLQQSSNAEGWRVVIIDPADAMNRSAANALLKGLEEPPKNTVFFLLSHLPGKLLPTLRSRCVLLQLKAPSIAATRDWLVDGHGVSVAEAQAASELAAGAPGRALALLQSGAVGLEKDVRDLLGRLPNWDTRASRRLAAKVSTKAGESLRPHLYASLTRNAARLAREAAQSGVAPEPWLDAWKAIQGLESEAEGVYLDAKQSALAAFAHMESAARASRL
jgi:DNA polymerase-3 subunit delta'